MDWRKNGRLMCRSAQPVIRKEQRIRATEPLPLPSVITDARKFLKMCVWRSFTRVVLIILHVEFRLPVLPRVFSQDIR